LLFFFCFMFISTMAILLRSTHGPSAWVVRIMIPWSLTLNENVENVEMSETKRNDYTDLHFNK
jgi:hypothetical protein